MKFTTHLCIILSLPSSWNFAKITKIIVQFITLENGTVVPKITKRLVEVQDEHSQGFKSSHIAGLFLAIFFVLGIFSNFILISAIASSVILKRLPFNVIIMNLGIIGLIEIVVNFTSSFVYQLTEPWHFGITPCWINTAFMEFTPIIYTIFLVILILDRMIALRSPSSYKKNVNARKYRVLILFVWILAIGIVSPVASGLITSLPFPFRYSCQIVDKNSMIFGLSVGISIYLLSWISIGIFSLLICIYINHERKLDRKFQQRDRFGGNKKYSSHTAFLFANAHLWNEIRYIFIIMAILGIYILFLCPYIILTKFDQILKGYGSGYNFEFYKNITLPQYKTTFDTDDDGKNISERVSIKRDPLYVPEANDDFLGPHDTVLVWMRYFHFSFLPFVIFILHRELKNKTFSLFRCCLFCRPNSVENKDSPRPVSAYIRQRRKELIKKQKRFKNSTNYSVPVLFVTSEGLYLRILDENYSGFSEHKSVLERSLESKSQWTVDPEFITDLCDLYPNFPQTLCVEKKSAIVAEDILELEERVADHIPLISIREDTPSPSPPPQERKVQFQSKIEEFSDIEIIKGTEEEDNMYPYEGVSDFEVTPKVLKKVKKKRKKTSKKVKVELKPINSSSKKKWNY